ncbi:hypothetical protein PVK06_023607 [Gossypium arboreum]|uniref:Uncharacterized protein n=1 Tax=Gossypium arboreum TaxID=29729 RepID=A0ABR0PBL4_GOSAR|nr:hypothetical protein PVK06_023607 [Gossypium arboreum]
MRSPQLWVEVGIEALTQVLREVLEKAFEASLERNRELVQSRCIDCGKKRDHSPPTLEPCSAKRVRTHLSDNSDFTEDRGSGASAPLFETATCLYSRLLHCTVRHIRQLCCVLLSKWLSPHMLCAGLDRLSRSYVVCFG